MAKIEKSVVAKSKFITRKDELTGKIISVIAPNGFQVGLKNNLGTSSDLLVYGDGKFHGGVSGSLTQLIDGTSYIVAGSNMTITSASNGAVTIAQAAGTAGPGGSDTQVQYNDGGAFGGAADLTFNDSTGDVTVGGSTGNAKLFFRDTGNYIYSNADGNLYIINADGTLPNSIKIDAEAGGIDIDAAGAINIKAESSTIHSYITSAKKQLILSGAKGLQVKSDSGTIKIAANKGAVDIDCGTTFKVDADSDFSIDGVGTSNVTTNGALTISGSTGLNLHSDGGEIDVTTTAAGADIDMNAAGSIHLTSTEDVVNAISLTSNNVFFSGGDQDNAYLFYNKPLHLEIITTPASALGKLWSSSGYILNWGGTGLTVTGSGHFNKTGADYDFRVETSNKPHAIFADGGTDQVLILSGGAGSSSNDAASPDINFYVSGAIGSHNSSDRGTTLFGGDLVTSGNLHVYADSSNTSARTLATIHNDNTAAVGATGLHVKNDAVASTAKQTVLIETTVASEDNPLLRLKNSNADANGPILRFENSAGADGSDDDFVGTISFYGEDDGTPTDVEYAKIAAQATDVSAAAKNGTVAFTAMVANAAREVARMNPESSTAGTFLGGFGYRRPVIEVTGATYVLTADQSGVILALNRPAGITVTLPADTNTGFHCKMVVLDTFTGTWKVATESDGDLLLGGISIVSAAAKADSFGSNGSSHDTMTMNSDPKGRFKGGSVEFTSVAADKWLVSGVLNGGGVPANPFTNS